MVNDPQVYIVELENGFDNNISCRTNGSLICVINVLNRKMLE